MAVMRNAPNSVITGLLATRTAEAVRLMAGTAAVVMVGGSLEPVVDGAGGAAGACGAPGASGAGSAGGAFGAVFAGSAVSAVSASSAIFGGGPPPPSLDFSDFAASAAKIFFYVFFRRVSGENFFSRFFRRVSGENFF